MFDLEKAISEWRRQMIAAGIKTPVPLEELESHLREDFERQIQSSANEEQAFAIAVWQIGHSKELKTEFKKGRRLMSILEIELVKKEWDLKWMPIVCFVLYTCILIFFSGMVIYRFGALEEATSSERLSSLSALVMSYLLSIFGLLGCKYFPAIPAKRTRDAICVCSAVVVSLVLMIFLVHVNVNMQQFFTEFSWVFLVPFGGLIGLIQGLERAAHKKIKAASL
jgi:hypothetical protein